MQIIHFFYIIIFLLHVTLSRLSRSEQKSPTKKRYKILCFFWRGIAWQRDSPHRTLLVKQPNLTLNLSFFYYYSNTFLNLIQILILFIIQKLFLFKCLFYSKTYLFKYLFYSNTYIDYYSNTYFIYYLNTFFIQILILFKYISYMLVTGHPRSPIFKSFLRGAQLRKTLKSGWPRVTGDQFINTQNPPCKTTKSHIKNPVRLLLG